MWGKAPSVWAVRLATEFVYENGNVIGTAKMKQVSVGFQFGGQAYREVIFFENKAALDRFKENKFEFRRTSFSGSCYCGCFSQCKI
jgi:hypothetical protein